RYQRSVDLNGDNRIDGQDAFLFADVFGNETASASLTVSTGKNSNARVELDPTDNGFLIYLNGVSGIGGYRIVISMPDSVKIRSVEDHFGMGLLPIRRTSAGTEIVGLVLGNQNLDQSGLLAGITFTGDTTGVSISSVSLRGKRINLGNKAFLGDRNEVSSGNIKRVPLGDLLIRPRYFDLGELVPGETVTRTFDIVNTFNPQQTLGATRKLPFEITSSRSDLTVDPQVFGVLTDTLSGLIDGGTKKVTIKFAPTQTGDFRGVLSIKTNRKERPVVQVHVKADVPSSRFGSKVRVLANFDTLKSVDYGDFDQLVTRFGKAPDSTKYDLDRDGVVDGDDAFLLADLLGGFEGRASYDTVRVVTGRNASSAVRVQSSGDELSVSVRDLGDMGGYRLNLSYDPKVLDVRWAKDLAGGGMMPVHRTSTGAYVVGMGFGALLENPGDLPLAKINMRALNGQGNASSLVRITDVVFRGKRGERDSVSAVHIGGNGLDASPRVLDFGPLRIGATVTKTFRVYNLSGVSTAFQITSSDTLVKTSPRSIGNLGGGRTWDITVTYQSVKPGPFAATLTLKASDSDSSAIRIAVKSFGAVVNVVPDSLAFDDTFVGQRATQAVTVTNPNLTAFEIQSVRFSRSDTAFVLDPRPTFPLSVSPGGGTQALTVRFNPLASGQARDTLYIVGKDTSFATPLAGRGLRRLASVSGSSVTFGNVEVGKDSTLSVVVSNLGNVTYRIDSLRIGRKDTSFSLLGTHTFPETLAVARLDTFLLRFRPDTSGAKRDTLRLYTQDTLWTVALAGVGLPRPIVQPPPLEDVVVVTFGGSITRSRNLIHFGKVPWVVSDTAKVRVRNQRNVNMTFRFSSTDPQVKVKPDSVQNLPPNQEWDVILAFTPKDSVQTVSEFRISTSESGDGVTSLSLKSGGSNPVLSDSLLSFGRIGLNNHLDKSVRITNTGHSRLLIDSLQFRPDSNFVLVQPPGLPLSLAAEGGSETFTLRFQPRARGTFSNSLRFSGLDTTFSLPVTGIGRESKLSFVPEPLDFGLVRAASRDTLTLQVKNAGGDTVVVNSLRLSGATVFSLASAQVVPDTLIPGATRNIAIVFSPLAAGFSSDSLLIVAGLDSIRAPILGTGTVARATISSLSRTLGALAVGRSLTDTITVTNAGNVPIAVRSARLSNGQREFSLVSQTRDTLAVNSALRYVVRFRPDSTRSAADTLRIEMIDTSFAVVFAGVGDPSLTLTRTDKGIVFSPGQLDFAELATGQVGRRIIRVVNNASSPWSFTIELAEAGLSISPASFTGLPTAPSWDLVANWLPVEGGHAQTTLRVKSDSTTTVPVGRNGAFLRAVPDSLAFGSVRLGQDSTRVLSIRNRGQARVVIRSLVLPQQAGFAFVPGPAMPLSLSENDSVLIRIRFKPETTGRHIDTLRVVASD
ncbi:MAG: choice-of-anchor D domain-containing protein, partial [bacterium]|nr:choice-of-anchor D domain-containing protein [bacterium]